MAGVHVLIPAAGAARRMRGGDKLLEPVGGVPQLRRAVDAARAGGARKVWVSVQPEDRARRATFLGTLAKPIEIPGWREGMAASLRAGARAAAAQGASALIVLLPDLPEIGAEDVARLIAAHATAPDAVWRAAAEDGTPGHPVLIPARLFEAMAALTGDAGARALLAPPEDVRLLPLPGRRAVTDLDTPEDWAAWRAATGN
ncbi:MAG: nucleotidyltransferase family protein [Rhodobacteraceae bacterium]|nr:nucleotidyltransferase family protein [Paracoccaceae bacterium]